MLSRTFIPRAVRRLSCALGLLLCLLSAAAVAGEPHSIWQVTPRIEHSQVVVNRNAGQWDAWSVELAHATAPGDWLRASFGRQTRNGFSDSELHLSADWRLGAWNASTSVQASPDPVFLPRWAYQADVDHAIGRNSRAGAGYRQMQFNDSSVQLWSTHATFYRGDDELGVEYRFGRNAVLDHDIRVLQVRAVKVSGRNQLAVYLARGDYLFDALGIPGGQGSGWSATFAFAHAVTSSTTVRWELGAGGEADVFRQRSFAVSVQYRP